MVTVTAQLALVLCGFESQRPLWCKQEFPMLNRKVRASRALRGCGKRLALLRQGYDVGSSPTTAYFKARLIRAFSFKISYR